MKYVWVTYFAPRNCLCWMDAVCPHGWTWQPEVEPFCEHSDYILEDVHESLADAVRNLFQESGAETIGRLLRLRWSESLVTRTVFVMPPSTKPWVCDHDALDGAYPKPRAIIERKDLLPRSRPGDPFRVLQDRYRGSPLSG